VDYAALVVENLPLIQDVVRLIARRNWLSADEADDLAGAIRLKLIENDYEVLRKFEGRCQLRTYLVTVVQRHFLDQRNARWGKWRPSAQAKRLGAVAMLLDQLVTRDNLSFDEAVAAIQARHGAEISRDQLHAILLQLPTRSSRHFVGEEQLQHVAADAPTETDVIHSLESERLGSRIERALERALGQLSDEDRLILKLRFCENVKLARIAEIVGQPAKQFYRRVEDIMRTLQKELQAQGVKEADVVVVTEHPGRGIRPVLELTTLEKTMESPSLL
jgi:RNA polymerase sigma factor for flagellar operon FliA